MNMLLNSERPRFDSDLWSALLRPQPASAAGARNTAARELGAVISISAAPAARMRRGGPQRLGSRSLEAPRQARRPVRVRTCEQLAYFALSCRGIPQTLRAKALSACTARRPRQDDIRGQFGQRARLRHPISRRAAYNSHAPRGFWPL